MGLTIRYVLRAACKVDPTPQSLRERAKEKEKSESNGSLMRISPLAVYLSKITKENVLENIVQAEVSMTHANQCVIDAAIAYCIAVRHLINTGDRKGAYEAAR